MKLVTLVDRNTGQARNFVVDAINQKTLRPILEENLAREARLMTDEAGWYKSLGKDFADHQTVQHRSKEYVRQGDATIHTNTIEGYFSIFKRGMKGVYQHCAKKHLHRYAAEFEFRYNNRKANGVDDSQRALNVLSCVSGKRLTYKLSN